MKIVRYLLLPIVFLFLGICLGIIVRDFPKFTLDYHIKITDIIKIILTFGIGIFVPLIVKKLIEDKRSFKNSLMEEVSSFNKIASRINDRLNTIYTSGKLTQKDKDGFTLLFEISDDEFNELCNFILEHCNTESKKYIEDLKTKQIEYWKTLTGSEITVSSAKKINDLTYRNASRQFSEIKAIIRKIKTSINNM
jgi:hypothetical protein